MRKTSLVGSTELWFFVQLSVGRQERINCLWRYRSRGQAFARIVSLDATNEAGNFCEATCRSPHHNGTPFGGGRTSPYLDKDSDSDES